MGFLKDIPDYKGYLDNDYHMTDIPDKSVTWNTLQAYANKAENFRSIVCQLRDIALLPPTTNTGYPWLVEDLQDAFRTIRKKTNEGKIACFYDAIAAIAEEVFLDEEEINEFLFEQGLGYKINKGVNKYNWIVRDNTLKMSDKIDKTLHSLKKRPFDQAVENLQQAKLHFQNLSNERALKDAIRDCASAMESIIKILGKDDDIKKASKNLRTSKSWGLDDIVKDGEAIFNKLHYLYPDFRHGSTGMSNMTINEAKYWADQMICFIDYILRQKHGCISKHI